MPLSVGAAELDITPPLGTHLNGDLCRHRPADRVRDRLFARALVVQPEGAADASQRLCLLTLDLCTIGDECGQAIRTRLSDEFGFDPNAIVIHLLQNHSAPSLGTHLFFRPDSPCLTPDLWWTYTGDPAYNEYVLPLISEVVRQALARLEPVTMAASGMADSRIAFNRRFILRNGWVQTQPVGEDLVDVLCSDGPADPEVGVACFRNGAGKAVAAVLHHTGHPVSLFGTNTVTASWPGAWVRAFKRLVDPGCVAMVVNGCCGNVNVYNSTGHTGLPEDDAIGALLAETSAKVLARLRFEARPDAGFRARRLDIPFGSVRAQIGEDAMNRAHALLASEPSPRWQPGGHKVLDIEWVFAAAITDLERRLRPGTSYSYLVQAFRIGDLALAGLVGEPFVEGQLAIKRQSPFRRTFVAHMCSGYIGYIPPRAAHDVQNFNFRGPDGQPVRRGANLFLLAPDALDRITSEVVRQLGELHGAG